MGGSITISITRDDDRKMVGEERHAVTIYMDSRGHDREKALALLYTLEHGIRDLIASTDDLKVRVAEIVK